MIQEWEIIPEGNDIFPDRCRVSLTATADALTAIQDHFVSKVGKPWVPKKSKFAHCFYIYEFSTEDRTLLEDFLSNRKPLPSNGRLSVAAPPAPPPTPLPVIPPPPTRATLSPLPPAPEPPGIFPVPTKKPEDTLRIFAKEDLPAAPTPALASPASAQEDISSYFSNQEIDPDAESLDKFAPKKKGLGKKPGERKKKSFSDADNPDSEVQSASDALMDFFGGFDSDVARDADKITAAEPEPEAPPLPPAPPSMADELRESGLKPAAKIVFEDENAEPPPGYKLYRLAYFVPEDMGGISDSVHAVLVETLESRRMPFAFRRTLVSTYQWPDKSLIENLIADCVRKNVEVLICVGDEQKFEILAELCNEHNIKQYVLSREESRKKYWRLGMVTRIVL